MLPGKAVKFPKIEEHFDCHILINAIWWGKDTYLMNNCFTNLSF
jgi:hypothetical protein